MPSPPPTIQLSFTSRELNPHLLSRRPRYTHARAQFVFESALFMALKMENIYFPWHSRFMTQLGGERWKQVCFHQQSGQQGGVPTD